MPTRRKKIVPKAPRFIPPDAVTREYYRNLRKYADAYVRLMTAGLKHVVPALQEVAAYETPDPQPTSRSDSFRMDTNIEDRIKQLFESVQTELERSFPTEILQQWARSMISHVNARSKKSLIKHAGKADLEIAPLLNDKGMDPYFKNIIDENVGLIRSISYYRLTSFKNGIVYAITNDMPQDQLRKMIQGNYRVTKGKAAMLARDQVGKLNGRLNQYRQQQLGGTRYKWRGSNDSRERPDHVLLNGTTQRWDKPPITDSRTKARNHPGEDYQCRCHAEMIIEDLLD